MHGIFLLEDPIPLYRRGRAKLYFGFSARVNVNETDVTIELAPQAYVRVSVLDYVNLRRERGASSDVITRNLMTYRNRVIVEPSRNFGCVTEVIMRKAGETRNISGLSRKSNWRVLSTRILLDFIHAEDRFQIPLYSVPGGEYR